MTYIKKPETHIRTFWLTCVTTQIHVTHRGTTSFNSFTFHLVRTELPAKTKSQKINRGIYKARLSEIPFHIFLRFYDLTINNLINN